MADRRSFLRGLTTLPLIGGSVALIGKKTAAAAAVPVTDELFERYHAWVCWEHAEVLAEREHRRLRGNPLEFDRAAWRWQDRRRWALDLYKAPDDPAVRFNVLKGMPSNRAAVILSAAGVPLTGDAQ